jgi:hypothetical protein
MSSLTILNRQNFVPHEKKTDNLRLRSDFAVAEMASHSVTHHGTNLREGFSLSCYGVPDRGCDKTTVHVVLADLEDDFTHGDSIADPFRFGKPDSASNSPLHAVGKEAA